MNKQIVEIPKAVQRLKVSQLVSAQGLRGYLFNLVYLDERTGKLATNRYILPLSFASYHLVDMLRPYAFEQVAYTEETVEPSQIIITRADVINLSYYPDVIYQLTQVVSAFGSNFDFTQQVKLSHAVVAGISVELSQYAEKEDGLYAVLLVKAKSQTDFNFFNVAVFDADSRIHVERTSTRDACLLEFRMWVPQAMLFDGFLTQRGGRGYILVVGVKSDIVDRDGYRLAVNNMNLGARLLVMRAGAVEENYATTLLGGELCYTEKLDNLRLRGLLTFK